MSNKFRKILAFILVGIGLMLYLAAIVFAYLSRSATLPADWGPWYSGLISSTPNLLGLLLGVVLIIKLPDNPYGWVWVLLGLSIGCVLPAFQNYAIYALMVYPGIFPFGWVAAWIAGYSWFVGISMMPLVLLLFPTGRPPTRGWNYVFWMVITMITLGLLTAWTIGTGGMVPIPDPNALSGRWVEQVNIIASIALGAIFLAIPLGAISLLHRYRLARQVERNQIKWFAYGSIVFVLTLASDFLYSAPGAWEPVKEALFFAVLPATIGIAILRYRLWDIDVLIRKTLVYGVLTAALALVFFGGVTLLQGVFQAVSGEQSAISIVVSTLAIAALFNPLRRRIQNGIDRRFYRRKYDAQKTLERFAASARGETDIEQLSAELLAVVEETVQPAQISLWLTKGKNLR